MKSDGTMKEGMTKFLRILAIFLASIARCDSYGISKLTHGRPLAKRGHRKKQKEQSSASRKKLPKKRKIRLRKKLVEKKRKRKAKIQRHKNKVKMARKYQMSKRSRSYPTAKALNRSASPQSLLTLPAVSSNPSPPKNNHFPSPEAEIVLPGGKKIKFREPYEINLRDFGPFVGYKVQNTPSGENACFYWSILIAKKAIEAKNAGKSSIVITHAEIERLRKKAEEEFLSRLLGSNPASDWNESEFLSQEIGRKIIVEKIERDVQAKTIKYKGFDVVGDRNRPEIRLVLWINRYSNKKNAGHYQALIAQNIDVKCCGKNGTEIPISEFSHYSD